MNACASRKPSRCTPTSMMSNAPGSVCIFCCSDASGAPATLLLPELSPCCNPRCKAWLSQSGGLVWPPTHYKFPPGHRRRPRGVCSLGLCFFGSKILEILTPPGPGFGYDPRGPQSPQPVARDRKFNPWWGEPGGSRVILMLATTRREREWLSANSVPAFPDRRYLLVCSRAVPGLGLFHALETRLSRCAPEVYRLQGALFSCLA